MQYKGRPQFFVQNCIAFSLKPMFTCKNILTSAIKKQTSVCCSISLNPYMVFQTWKSGIMEKKEKRKANLLLAYIADVRSLTNRPFYMQILYCLIFSRPQFFVQNCIAFSLKQGLYSLLYNS